MKTTAATTETAAIWQARVRDWRASGQTAAVFARDKGFAASTLTRWGYQVGRADPTRFVRLVPATPPAPAPPSRELLVEVGAARVRVATGFDPALLAQVVAALGGPAR